MAMSKRQSDLRQPMHKVIFVQCELFREGLQGEGSPNCLGKALSLALTRVMYCHK